MRKSCDKVVDYTANKAIGSSHNGHAQKEGRIGGVCTLTIDTIDALQTVSVPPQ